MEMKIRRTVANAIQLGETELETTLTLTPEMLRDLSQDLRGVLPGFIIPYGSVLDVAGPLSWESATGALRRELLRDQARLEAQRRDYDELVEEASRGEWPWDLDKLASDPRVDIDGERGRRARAEAASSAALAWLRKTQDEERAASAAAADVEMRAWVESHGSPTVREMMRIDVGSWRRIAAEEHALSALGDGWILETDEEGEAKTRTRPTLAELALLAEAQPTLAELALLAEARKIDPEASLAWWFPELDENDEQPSAYPLVVADVVLGGITIRCERRV